MVIVAFKPGEKEISKYEELDQYDYGQILRIQGLNLPPAVEIHFALQKTGGTSKTRIGITKDGVTDVPIPDSMLENGDTEDDYSIYAFIYITDETSGQTEYRITLRVKARPKPEVPGGGDNPDIFHEVMETVRKAMEAATESEKQAEGWAHGSEDLPERLQDNAKYYSEQAREDSKKTDADRKEVERLVESVSGIEEQVGKVNELTKQAQKSATDAGLYKEAAESARRGAETAKTEAETAAGKTAEDKTAVETAKGEVLKAQEAVSTDRKAVESIKSGIEQLGGEIAGTVEQGMQEISTAKQQAVQAIEQTGTDQKNAVEASGTKAVQSVEVAQQTATEAIETAKSEAVQAVQTEGTTQAGNVSTEGEKQVQAVQGAAQEIVADRGQIQENKTGIAKLKEDIVGLDNRKADAIVETASGNPCNISDSSGLLIKKLNIYGESTQEGTPSPDVPVPIISKEISKITATGKELEKQEIILSKPITLRGIPVESGGNVTIDGKQYVSDMICEHNGIISVERNVEKALLKKDIVFTQTKDNPYRCACFVAIIGGGKFKKGPDTSLSNCFQWTAWGSNISSVKDKAVFAISESAIYISLPRTGAEPSKEEVENRVNELWQSVEDKVEFYAQLKTPVYEPLPEADQDAIKNLHSYYPNTTIECGAWTEVSYIADTKKYIDKKFEELNQAIVNTQIALL